MTTLRKLILLSIGLLSFSAFHLNAQIITCSSNDGRRHYCDADTRRGVDLVKQRSGSPCQFNATWGFDRRGIWVDRGCRADFVVRRVGGRPPVIAPGPAQILTCSSNDGRRNYCPADTRAGVQMVRQRSGSPCRLNATWGFDRRGVWVDRGCRADFQIGGAGYRR